MVEKMKPGIDIRTLTIEELSGVVNIYPWFSAARMELCRKVSRMGGEDWGISQFADSAMYISSRRMISDIIRSGSPQDYSDKDIKGVLKSYISAQSAVQQPDHIQEEHQAPVRKIAGGDFFSQDQYEAVREQQDNVFSRFAAKAKSEMTQEEAKLHDDFFCTETLAEIYAEQGYYDIAIRIYSKLLLANPEKNTYFAALIEKLKKEIQN